MNLSNHRLLLCFSLVTLADGFIPIQCRAGRSTFISRGSRTHVADRGSVRSSQPTRRGNKKPNAISSLDQLLCRHAKSPDSDDDENDDVTLDDEDWRAFRAKLVMGEKKTSEDSDNGSSSDARTSSSSENSSSILSDGRVDGREDEDLISDDGDLDGIGSVFQDEFVVNPQSEPRTETKMDEWTPLDPSQWAYDSGDVIEQGAVILGGIEQEFGFGLRQQYFHKTAILVLDHSPTFTKGIILNRPTDLTLEDDINPGLKWRVWFGGDVEGLNARHPDILCLHSLNDERATKASIPVMKDIQWTTFDNAKVRNVNKKYR